MVFDRHVLTLDITCFAEGVAERGHIVCHRIGRPEVYEPDHRHRRLLRACRERPRRRAAEERDELATLHVEHGGLPPLCAISPPTDPCARFSGASASHLTDRQVLGANLKYSESRR